MEIKRRLSIVLQFILVFLASCMQVSCANGQKENKESYRVAEVNHPDCYVYMMVFNSGKYSFRLSQSGSCKSVSTNQFIKDYEQLMKNNRNSLNLIVGNSIILDCYEPIDLKKKSDLDRLLKVTSSNLGIKVIVKEQTDERLELEIVKD